MNKSLPELIDYLDKRNRWKHDAVDNAEAIDQAVEELKTKMWQPMETAPQDREFLALWGTTEGCVHGYDVYKYIGQGMFESMNATDERLPTKYYRIIAWMDLPKYEL